MGVDLVFRIAAIGIMVAVLVQVLKQTGRDDIATIASLAGLIVVLLLVVDQLSTLFDSVRKLFNIY